MPKRKIVHGPTLWTASPLRKDTDPATLTVDRRADEEFEEYARQLDTTTISDKARPYDTSVSEDTLRRMTD